MVLYCKHIILSLVIILNIITMEIWKPVNGFENSYEVSNIGNLRSIDRYVKHYKGGLRLYKVKSKSIRLNKDGYYRCNLKKDGLRYDKLVHRLVAESFIQNPNQYTEVNHKNGIKSDNRVSNLEWCDKSINIQHAVKNRFIKTKLTDEQVLEVYNSDLSQRKLAKIYGVNHSVIWRIKNKKAYKHIFV